MNDKNCEKNVKLSEFHVSFTRITETLSIDFLNSFVVTKL